MFARERRARRGGKKKSNSQGGTKGTKWIEKRERARNKCRNNDPAMAAPDRTLPTKYQPRTNRFHLRVPKTGENQARSCFGPSLGTEGDSQKTARFSSAQWAMNCNARGVGRDRWPIEERIEDVQLPAGSK